jgi:hypothetical protein
MPQEVLDSTPRAHLQRVRPPLEHHRLEPPAAGVQRVQPLPGLRGHRRDLGSGKRQARPSAARVHAQGRTVPASGLRAVASSSLRGAASSSGPAASASASAT